MGCHQPALGKRPGEPGWGCACPTGAHRGCPLGSCFSHAGLMQAGMPTSGCVCYHSLCDFHRLFKSEPVISIVGGRSGEEEGEEGSVKEKLGFFCPLSGN